jgi:hypothetical protein
MSLWLLITCATAGGGALLLWHVVSRTKHASEQMLDAYQTMLRQARENRAMALAQAEAQRAEAEAEAAQADAAARCGSQ